MIAPVLWRSSVVSSKITFLRTRSRTTWCKSFWSYDIASKVLLVALFRLPISRDRNTKNFSFLLMVSLFRMSPSINISFSFTSVPNRFVHWSLLTHHKPFTVEYCLAPRRFGAAAAMNVWVSCGYELLRSRHCQLPAIFYSICHLPFTGWMVRLESFTFGMHANPYKGATSVIGVVPMELHVSYWPGSSVFLILIGKNLGDLWVQRLRDRFISAYHFRWPLHAVHPFHT